jgi:hypothetical protein
MRLAVLPMSCLLIVSCNPQSPEQGSNDVTPSRASTPTPVGTTTQGAGPTPGSALAPIATLAGEWRVAGIDGKDFNEPYGLALSANGDELWWAPRCAGMARSYRIDGTRIQFSPPADERVAESGAPAPPPPCIPGRPARLADVMRALDAATAVGRTPSNGIEISGGGHSVLLFSQ